eukprot:symbB.v1.2.024923.t3/scaffold2393.1/size80293/2
MLLDVFLTFVPFCQAQIQQRELLKRRRSGASRASEASSPASPVDTKQRRPSPKPSGTPEVMSATPFPMPKQEEPPMSPLCNELENRISGSDDELQMCTVADEQRTVAFMFAKILATMDLLHLFESLSYQDGIFFGAL